MELKAIKQQKLLKQILMMAMASLGVIPAAKAEESKVITLRDSEVLPVREQFSYFVDTTRNKTIDDILSPTLQAEFRPASPSIMNSGFTNAAYWLKITVKNESKSERWNINAEHPLFEEFQP